MPAEGMKSAVTMNAVDPASRERDAEPARGRSVSVTIAFVSATILIGAAVVRALASAGDLWLDEIWSLTLASSVNRCTRTSDAAIRVLPSVSPTARLTAATSRLSSRTR